MKKFKTEVEDVFQRLNNQVKQLAVEVSKNQQENEQNIINKANSQFYACLLNKLENGLINVCYVK